MDNSSPDSGQTDIEQFPPEQERAAQDVEQVVYRYVNKNTGVEIPAERVHFESEEIHPGDVAEIDTKRGKPEYLSVDHISEGEVTTVYLIRARSSLWKSLLLLAILGVGWYVIDLVLKHIF